MTGAEVCALFDRSPSVPAEELVGRWRGSELPTGHRLDGLLTAYGWYGKEVVDAETVHPLLFPDRRGVPRPVDPTLAPLGLLREHPWLARTPPARAAFALVRPLLTTRRPAARVREVRHRGVVTAAVGTAGLEVRQQDVGAHRGTSPPSQSTAARATSGGTVCGPANSR